MKKLILSVGLFLGFFSSVFGQKTWFLSAEVSPAIRFHQYRDFGDFSGQYKGPIVAKFSSGVGFRLFRQSRRWIQPEIGIEFRDFKLETNWGHQEFEQTTRQFAISSDMGFRLESRPFLKKWRVSAGATFLIWIPFLSKIERSFDETTFWGNFYDDPNWGLGYSVNFGRILSKGRRADFGIQLQNFYEEYFYYGDGERQFRMLKFRAAISIDKIIKHSVSTF